MAARSLFGSFLQLMVVSIVSQQCHMMNQGCTCDDIEDKINSAILKNTEQTIKAVLKVFKQHTTTDTQLEKSPDNRNDPDNIGKSPDNPARSCAGLQAQNRQPCTACSAPSSKLESGKYWIKPSDGSDAVQVYCDMSLTCGGMKGGWMQVADLDMTNPNQQCPDGFDTMTTPKRVCMLKSPPAVPSYRTCAGVSYPVHGLAYSHVCGRIIGYLYNNPGAFYNSQLGIDAAYVFGVSVTHGQPKSRSHIWTLAAPRNDNKYLPEQKCPCINKKIAPGSTKLPAFVGNDYFCDTPMRNNNLAPTNVLQVQDPLWDGEGCSDTNMCCDFPGGQVKPPWFYKKLSSSTTDELEMRLCMSNSWGQTPIEIVELYVQ